MTTLPLRLPSLCSTCFSCLAALFSAAPLSAQTPADFDARARGIVAQMTLDEKVSQMHGTQNKQQFRVVVGVPRLGIPDLLVTNGPAGLGPAGPGHQGAATALPAPVALAATWDVAASKTYGQIAGGESRDFGNTLLESPDVNIARVPQNGRTFEAFGEDPFLVARLAVAHIQGVQGEGVIANVKHYAANNQEAERGTVDVEVDERTLHEIYLPAFEASIKEAGCGSIMGAYNKVNGFYCCENPLLLNEILKHDWAFDGFVTSDFGAVHSTVPSVLAGLDLEMPSGAFLAGHLKAAVESGQVPMAVLDDHLVRRFRTMMKLGVWDHLPAQKPIDEQQHGEEARRLAEEAVVLLRNEHAMLPLDAGTLKTVALIGPYATHASTGGGGSSRVKPVYGISPLDGLQKRLGARVAVQLLDGADLTAAVAAAHASDLAIVMVGDAQTEGKDHNLALSGNQDALVAGVVAANPRTVVVVKSGGPVLMPWAESVPAILEAWYPGEEDGNAVAAVLLGDQNPSGRLPITFPKALEDLPAHTPEQYPGTGPAKQTTEHYSEGVFVGYRWYDAKNLTPQFAFGYGLSYTTFGYDQLRLSSDSLPASNPSLTVAFQVRNLGRRAGAAVPQVYVGIPAQPGVDQPPRQLKGFARVGVEPGATANVEVKLDARAFSYWDVATHTWKVPAGDFHVYVGESSRDLRLQGKVTVR